MFEVYKAFYWPRRQNKSLTIYIMELKKTYELHLLLYFRVDIKVQLAQNGCYEFLLGLPSKFDTIKSHILSSSKIPHY